MWTEIVLAIVTALGTVLFNGIQAYLEKSKVAKLQQQLGAMTYEKIAHEDERARAEASITTKRLLGTLSDADLSQRVRDTNDAIRKANKAS